MSLRDLRVNRSPIEAPSPSGKAEVCKTSISSSNLDGASNFPKESEAHRSGDDVANEDELRARETVMHEIISVDLLVLDDFAIDVLDGTESRDLYDILLERYRTGSIVVTSNRGPDEWLATFADPIRAQSAIDRFTSNAYDLIIEGESHRPRLKPRLTKDSKERSR